ncbi:rolling circle replication-associated protein [Ralstonia pseudosolanacearum]|uniref:rolling circle replication-associated protein n=1 Tax=Ralstonia pseudosolanacearum TaxID=1310165 RepID=UPI0008FCCC23|nr:inovirus Gp2 family protein [Ralstonia solanacearum OE1-1]TXE00981.1 inovirus Gp2 family protein [Ralstonia pseudosolanacearum]BCM01150.1 hypothetical protein MAFF301560_05370 [Ralstonia solanacearum]BEU48099.1 hypothetical protein MAFF211519_34240 [Ralstonia pseudosolanacearum]
MSFEDDFEQVHEFSEQVRNTEIIELDGEETSVLYDSYRLLKPSLIRIEQMAREVEFAKEGKFFEIKQNQHGKQLAVPTALGRRYYSRLATFHQLATHSRRYVFSAYVEAVVEALQSAGLHFGAFTFGEPTYRDPYQGRMHAEVANEVGAKLVEILDSKAFKSSLRARRRNVQRNEARGLSIERQVFANKSRALVLMLHFGYLDQYRDTITPEEIQKHRRKFFNNCRSNKLLRGIVDYIWKLEDGDRSGLHLHVLIFYTTKAFRDVLIAKLIGDYWVKVTDGKGRYWNSNANKDDHATRGFGVGTGEINWDDHDKREALRKVVQYMTKADQYVRARCGEHSHLFGTSQVKEKAKSGRPRNVQSVAEASACFDQTDPPKDE